MHLTRIDYNDRLDVFKGDIVEKNDALHLGRVFHILPYPIQKNIIENKEHYGLAGKLPLIRDESGLLVASTKHLENIKSLWKSSKILRCPGDRNDENNHGRFIWEFNEFLSNFIVTTIDDVRKLHIEICKFLKKYCVYGFNYRHHEYSVESTCKFLIFSILENVVKTCDIIYKYVCTKEEYEMYSSFFSYYEILIMDVNDSKLDERQINLFGNTLCNLYELYQLNNEYIHGSSEGVDPFLLLYIHGNNFSEDDLRIKAQQLTLCVNLHKFSDTTNIYESAIDRIFYENSSDVSVYSQDFSGKSDTDITVFGDSGVFRSITGNMENLKRDLLEFNSDSVRSYMDKDENVRVNFVIDEQIKMYLQAELNCKMLVANIRSTDENNMLTILNYENDNFVLFMLSDDSDTLYGLSINEDNMTKERKLISIDRDDDLTFQFVINIEEE